MDVCNTLEVFLHVFGIYCIYTRETSYICESDVAFIYYIRYHLSWGDLILNVRNCILLLHFSQTLNASFELLVIVSWLLHFSQTLNASVELQSWHDNFDNGIVSKLKSNSKDRNPIEMWPLPPTTPPPHPPKNRTSTFLLGIQMGDGFKWDDGNEWIQLQLADCKALLSGDK